MKKSELKNIIKQLIKESVDDLVYSNEIVASDPSIDSLIELYSGDYIDYVNRGSAKFFDYGDTFKLTFNLNFPKKKVEFKSLNAIYNIVSKSLNFFKKSSPFGKGEVSKLGENDNYYILRFIVRGGK